MEFKKHGKVLIPIGWVLIVLTVLSLIGMLRQPRHRNPFIESFLNQPDSISLSGGALGAIIGSNILTLLVALRHFFFSPNPRLYVNLDYSCSVPDLP